MDDNSRCWENKVIMWDGYETKIMLYERRILQRNWERERLVAGCLIVSNPPTIFFLRINSSPCCVVLQDTTLTPLPVFYGQTFLYLVCRLWLALQRDMCVISQAILSATLKEPKGILDVWKVHVSVWAVHLWFILVHSQWRKSSFD